LGSRDRSRHSEAPALSAAPIAVAKQAARVGNLALAIARSWSNGLTVSAGVFSIIGGPLHTGRRRAIDQIIRTTAPMHDGFAGGAFVDTGGELLGITTASTIRGLGVVIPAGIAWTTAQHLLEHGGLKRAFSASPANRFASRNRSVQARPKRDS
jgi:S1-C subfamily serine protease